MAITKSLRFEQPERRPWSSSTSPHAAAIFDVPGGIESHAYAPPMEHYPVDVTAAVAQHFLRFNVANRGEKVASQRRYARTMAASKWVLTYEPIAFDTAGNLCNGQNRLRAVIEADKLRPGISVPMMVCLNVDPAAMSVVDTPAVRTIADALRTLGFADANKCHSSIASMMMGSVRFGMDKAPTRDEKLEFIVFHLDAISFSITPKSGANSRAIIGPTQACVARAWYTQDRDRLREFLAVLSTGRPGGAADGAAIALRNAIFANKELTNRGGDGRTKAYRRCQTALKAFLEHRNLETVRESNTEYFPIPDVPSED